MKANYIVRRYLYYLAQNVECRGLTIPPRGPMLRQGFAGQAGLNTTTVGASGGGEEESKPGIRTPAFSSVTGQARPYTSLIGRGR